MRSGEHTEPTAGTVEDRELLLSSEPLIELMRAVLARGVPFRFRARGCSMTPFIRDGDIITVGPLGHSLPAVGEVVAFVHPHMHSLVVHRVVARTSHGCIVQADHLSGPGDGLIDQTHILGRVQQVQRNGRNIWLGLGPERYLIAFLSRAGLLVPLRAALARLVRPFRRLKNQ